MHEFDVTISDPNVWVTQIKGPESMDVLRDVIDGDFPDPWRYFDIATVSIAGQDIIITRTGFPTSLDGSSIFNRNTILKNWNRIWDIGKTR